ncbi:MAG: hypothetical protein R3C53_08340 [Pirellulaceae bacterium]
MKLTREQVFPDMQKSRRNQVPSSEARIQRVLLGGASLLFFALGALAAWSSILDDGSRGFASGSLLKVGVVLGIAWLAAPQLERFGWQRLRGTMLLGVVAVLALFAIRPKIGAIAGAVFVGGSIFFSVLGWVRKFTKPPRM